MSELTSILFVTHEATLTGAPMNLLHFVRWVKENTNVRVEVVALRGGPLVQRFEEVCPTTVLDKGRIYTALDLGQRALLHLGSTRAWRHLAAARLGPQLRRLGGFDAVYLSSAASISVLPFLPQSTLVVSHVHELDVAFVGWRPTSDLDCFVSMPHLWIAASGAVERLLVDQMGLPQDRVAVHHEFIDVDAISGRARSLAEREQVLRTVRRDGIPEIPTDASIVMGSGTIDWRKGADLFVQLAGEVARQSREPIWFVWVGGDHSSLEMNRLVADIQRSGVHRLRYVAPQRDPVPWFAAADVFALTSREDPFPLVCLEHAALGNPIVAYRSGGIHEFLDAAGPTASTGNIDYLDVGTFARRTLEFLTDSELRRQASAELRSRVASHHDVSVAAPRLFESLDRAFSAERTGTTR